MTEKEIIAFLKENKKNGVAFAFMPREVGIWCCEHRNEEIFHMFYYSSWNGKCGINCRDSAIYCLDEDYEPKPETHYKELDKEREEMTEQEIIAYLKKNKCKGVAFMLMPQEVKVWCKEHEDEPIFSRLCSAGWDYTKRAINTLEKNGVYFLSRDYEPNPQFKAHWEEFPINKDGMFFIITDDGKICHYHWWEWTKFLSDNSTGYNNFGGWVYETSLSNGEEIEALTTCPHILEYGKDLSYFTFLNGRNESKPAWPAKVLFWRYKE